MASPHDVLQIVEQATDIDAKLHILTSDTQSCGVLNCFCCLGHEDLSLASCTVIPLCAMPFHDRLISASSRTFDHINPDYW